MPKIKICGITNLEDGTAAIGAGADMLGFNFYLPSSRYLKPARARQMIERLRSHQEGRPIAMVGVFVNESIESLMHIARDLILDAIQLHGEETPEYCTQLKTRLPEAIIIKALRVNGAFEPRNVTSYLTDAIMLDAFHEKLRGGTGQTIDWNIARATRDLVPQLFLSGGLSPENVTEAIARVQPFAVDACSSLEASPGRKDPARVKEFVRAVRNG